MLPHSVRLPRRHCHQQIIKVSKEGCVNIPTGEALLNAEWAGDRSGGEQSSPAARSALCNGNIWFPVVTVN